MKKKTNPLTTVLVVDDEASITLVLSRALAIEGFRCLSANSAADALKLLGEENIDVVITDLRMPVMDGIELTARVKAETTADVIMMTGYFKDMKYSRAVELGASDFLEKPFETDELLIRLSRVVEERRNRLKLRQHVDELRDILQGFIGSLSATVEARDPYTSGHQKRVRDIAVAIATEMGLDESSIFAVHTASLIHDLGKIAVPAEILAKPSRLTDPEIQLIRNHPATGYQILKDINFRLPIAQITYQHHERLNGSGYPNGLSGEEILLEARIIAVADVVEAISSHRPYRPALGMDVAIEEVKNNRDGQYDPAVVEAFLNVHEQFRTEYPLKGAGH